MYALFKDGVQISEAKETELSAVFEAFKCGCIITSEGRMLTTEGYTIEKIKENIQP